MASRFQRFLLPGFAFKAVVIGGGYATGRELAEYFLPSGPRGAIAGMLLAMMLWSAVCAVTFLFARRCHAFDYSTFVRALLGRGWIVFEAAYVLFVVVILAVFGAAAGAIGQATLGAPRLAGTIALMTAIALVVAFGNASVERLFKYVSILLYAVYACFGLLALTHFGDRILAGFSSPVPPTGWALGGLTYAAYNIVGAVVILPVLRHLTSDRDAVMAGVIAGPLAVLPALVFLACMVAYYPEIAGATLPSDFLLQRLNLPAFHLIFQLMIFAALLESGTGAVHAINERIANAWRSRHGRQLGPRSRLILALAMLIGCMFLAEHFGLVALIAHGYRALAVVFLLVYVGPLLTVGVARLLRVDPVPTGKLVKCILPVVVCLVFSGKAMSAPPERFAQRVEVLRNQIGVPGMAITIVEDDRVTFAQGFGIKALGKPGRVDADTIFPTGSTGKAFTVADLGILADQGKIAWDDKVIDRLPGFQLYDPWVTREITIRDLLVHRSGLGLGEGDLLFVPRSNLTRVEAVRRLRFLQPVASFRSGFHYDNVLYMVAGQLIESVTGESWERFTAEHLLKPAGMLSSTADNDAFFENPNRAQPHARIHGPLRGIGEQSLLDEHDELGRSAAPAGGLAISANDMARWIRIQLSGGSLPDSKGRLFSEASHEQMWESVVPLPIEPRPKLLQAETPQFNSYALGWELRDYRGARIVWHGGAVFGFCSAVVLIPERRVGFAIEINSEDREIIKGLMFELLDHYLGQPKNDWPTRFRTAYQQEIDSALRTYNSAAAHPAQVGPSLAPAGYTGTYADPWYGDIEIAVVGGKPTIDFKSTPRMSGTLEHWQYDSFITRFEDKTIEPAYVTFSLDADGKVDRVTLKPVSPLADFSYDYQDLLFRPARH